jgi:hypothetical protein
VLTYFWYITIGGVILLVIVAGIAALLGPPSNMDQSD